MALPERIEEGVEGVIRLLSAIAPSRPSPASQGREQDLCLRMVLVIVSYAYAGVEVVSLPCAKRGGRVA